MAEKLPAGFDPLSAEPQSPQMGALGQIIQNAGRNTKDEDLAFASGLMAPSSNGTSGALGNAYAAQSKYRLERDQLQAQYVPLILQSMAAQFQRDALGKLFGDTPKPGAAGAAPGADAAPGAGAGPAGMGGPAAAPSGAQAASAAQPAASSQNPGSKLAGYSIDQIVAFDKLTGLNMMDSWKIAKEGFERHPGSFYDIPGIGQMYQPDPTKGVGYANGKVYQLDNAGKVLGELAQATALGTKTAEAQTTPLPPTFVGASGKPIGGSTADYLGLGKTAAPAAGAPGAVPAAPAGGKGAANPDADQARILSAELDKYIAQIHQLDPKTTDPAVLKAANDDLQGVVKEMKRAKVGYVPEALRSVPLGAVTPGAIAQAESSTPTLQGPAEAAGQKVTSEEAAKSGQTYQNALHDKVEEEFQLVNRNKQIIPLLDKIETGGIAPEARVEIANTIQNTTSLPKSVRDNLAKWVANGDPTAGKVLQNQLASAGILTMLQTLDKEGKPNRAIFQAVQAAQEGLKSGNTTLKDVFELQNRLYGIHFDEQQAVTKAIKDGTYDPRTWAGDYSRIRNEQLKSPAAPLPSAKKTGADIDSLLKKYGG
jgi:hypothetical protein